VNVPEQKFEVGDLVVAIADDTTTMHGLDEGAVGIITDAFCYKVCIKGGRDGWAPEDGGPVFAMEWGYVGLFDVVTRPQGVRLDGLSPVKVVR